MKKNQPVRVKLPAVIVVKRKPPPSAGATGPTGAAP